MTKFALPALAAALALAACGDRDPAANAEAEEAMTATPDTGGTTVAAPPPSEAVVTGADAGTTATTDGSNVTINGRDVDATVGEDGVKARINVD